MSAVIDRSSVDTPRAGYCPQCFTSLAWSAQRCPQYGADLAAWSRLPYGQRLIHALRHPLAEVRMRAIPALGARQESEATIALANGKNNRGDTPDPWVDKYL